MKLMATYGALVEIDGSILSHQFHCVIFLPHTEDTEVLARQSSWKRVTLTNLLCLEMLVGVYSSAVIKKRRYWPKYIDREGIDQHFQTKEVSQCDSLPGTLSGKSFSIFCMKEENYTMKLMATYGALVVIVEWLSIVK